MFISSNFSLHYLWVASTTCCDGSSPSAFPRRAEPVPIMVWLSAFPPSVALAIAYFFPAQTQTGSFGPLALAYFSSQHILHFKKKKGFICYFIFYGLFYSLSLLQCVSLFTFNSLPFTCETKVSVGQVKIKCSERQQVTEVFKVQMKCFDMCTSSWPIYCEQHSSIFIFRKQAFSFVL